MPSPKWVSTRWRRYNSAGRVQSKESITKIWKIWLLTILRVQILVKWLNCLINYIINAFDRFWRNLSPQDGTNWKLIRADWYSAGGGSKSDMFDWYPAQEELGHPSHVLGFLPGAESGNSEFRAYYEFIISCPGTNAHTITTKNNVKGTATISNSTRYLVVKCGHLIYISSFIYNLFADIFTANYLENSLDVTPVTLRGYLRYAVGAGETFVGSGVAWDANAKLWGCESSAKSLRFVDRDALDSSMIHLRFNVNVGLIYVHICFNECFACFWMGEGTW